MTRPNRDAAAVARSKLRRATWVAAGTGALALVGALWMGLSATPRLDPPVLPEPNGFDDALRAAQVIGQAGFPDSRTLDVFKADAGALRPWVETNRDAVAALREAIGRPFQVPVVYDPSRVVEDANKAAPLRTIAARALFAEGRLAALEGRTDEAVAAYLDLIRLGNVMARNVPFMPYLASFAPTRVGLAGLRNLVEELDAETLGELVAGLEVLNDARVPASEPTRLELAFVDLNVRRQSGRFAGFALRLTGFVGQQKARVVSDIENAARRIDAEFNLLLADLALRRYRLVNGAPTETLGALVPSVLKAVPADPYTGGPLSYRKTDDGFVVYSFGPDGDDDGLKPTLTGRFLPTSNGDLTPDSFE